jgi:hypothetical protein
VTILDPSATEETGAIPVSSAISATSEVKESTRAFLQAARRDLTEDEAASPAGRRFLIAEIERLDLLCAEYQSLAQNYHDQRVEIATLKEAAKPVRWNQILSFVSLSIGSAGVGAAPNYFTIEGGVAVGLVVFGLSVVLVVVGIASQVWK